MVPVTALWLPILVAAVLVFVVSSVIHMFLTYHQSDMRAVPGEAAIRDALRPIPPGDYAVPHAGSPAAMAQFLGLLLVAPDAGNGEELLYGFEALLLAVEVKDTSAAPPTASAARRASRRSG